MNSSKKEKKSQFSEEKVVEGEKVSPVKSIDFNKNELDLINIGMVDNKNQGFISSVGQIFTNVKNFFWKPDHKYKAEKMEIQIMKGTESSLKKEEKSSIFSPLTSNINGQLIVIF